MLTLYGDQGKASLTPHVVLNEIGEPFEFITIDCDAGEQRSASYLRINTHGRIPTLMHDGHVVYETSAIVLHLVERIPAASAAAQPSR